jgi:chorismate mutase
MVADIERWRDEIDAIDAELLDLLNRRVRLALEVGRRKKDAGLPMRDLRRERQILARATNASAGPLGAAAVERLFRAILAESRRAARSAGADARHARKTSERAEGRRACA